MLLKALNNNVSTFSHLANEAKELSDSVIRISFDSVSKCVIFKWGLNIVRLSMQTFALSGITCINEFKVSDFELIKKFIEFEKFWTPKINDFFKVWETAKVNIENYMYFKAAFDQFIKFENDGVRFLQSVWYFGDVKLIAVVRKAGTNDNHFMIKEYYEVDQKKV